MEVTKVKHFLYFLTNKTFVKDTYFLVNPDLK